jgi:type I restriction enzyme R subunit
MGQDEMQDNIDALNRIFAKINEVNRLNELLRAKYEQDRKYARVHKRIREQGGISSSEIRIHDALMLIKGKVDDAVMNQEKLLDNDAYFTKMLLPVVIDSCSQNQIKLDAASARFIGNCIAREYLTEAHGGEAS